MDVVISTVGRQEDHDLIELRDWLASTGSGSPWQLAPEPLPDGDSLGIGVGEICAIITAATQLPILVDRIRDWFSTRHDPAPVHITIMLDPAATEHGEDLGQRDERLA